MKVKIGVKEVWENVVEVDVPDGADDEEILDIASHLMAKGQIGEDGETSYDYTLESEFWTIYK